MMEVTKTTNLDPAMELPFFAGIGSSIDLPFLRCGLRQNVQVCPSSSVVRRRRRTSSSVAVVRRPSVCRRPSVAIRRRPSSVVVGCRRCLRRPSVVRLSSVLGFWVDCAEEGCG